MRYRAWGVMAAVVVLLLVLSATAPLSQTTPQFQPGGLFGFSYPQFDSVEAARDFAATFAGAMTNPGVYGVWDPHGMDIRPINPGGAYLKHINIRVIDSTQLSSSGEGRPPYAWIKQNHPEWIIKDANGNPVPLFLGTEEVLDFGNDAYLDWVLDTWMPTQLFDAVDNDPTIVTWYMHDNGAFGRMYINCSAFDSVCQRYNTDEGVRTAWEQFLARFKAKYPTKKILINTGPLSYVPVADQMAVFQRILGKADGYYGECLTNTGCYWDTEPNNGKRLALLTTMQLAAWLADNGKVFFPNIGMTTVAEPTQTEMDYAWAFFNLLRNGEFQIFARTTKDSAGGWVPRRYPEMDRSVGAATELATELAPDVWRRDYTAALVYVNLGDAAVSLTLPTAGAPFTNALGEVVASPLVLGSFSGLTLYKAAISPTPTPPPPPPPPSSDTQPPTIGIQVNGGVKGSADITVTDNVLVAVIQLAINGVVEQTLTPNTATATAHIDLPQLKQVTLAVTATDAAGNVSTTNVTVTP
jgi:hypothetical protein